MRNLFKLTLTLLAATAWLPGAQAQSFPNRPIRVVVPFPTGGNVDTYIRQGSTRRLHHPGDVYRLRGESGDV